MNPSTKTAWDACLNSIKRPAAQKNIKALFEQGFHKPGDAEKSAGILRRTPWALSGRAIV